MQAGNLLEGAATLRAPRLVLSIHGVLLLSNLCLPGLRHEVLQLVSIINSLRGFDVIDLIKLI